MPIRVTELENLRSSLHTGLRPTDLTESPPQSTVDDRHPRKDAGESKKIKDKLANLMKRISSSKHSVDKAEAESRPEDSDTAWIAHDSWTKYLKEIEHPKPLLASHASFRTGWVDTQNSRNTAGSSSSKSPLSEFMTSSPECSD